MTSPSAASSVELPSAKGPGRGRVLGRIISQGLWGARNIDNQNVPASGKVILAANHTGVADGPVLIGMAPRPVHILIKREMFESAIGWLFRWTGQISTDRRAGRDALQKALGCLNRGSAIGIFPEGSRGGGDAASAQAGVAWLAVHSGAPVVPVTILGTRRTGESIKKIPGFQRRILVSYGEPIYTDPALGKGRAAVVAAVEQIAAGMREHIAQSIERTGIELPAD